MARIRTIKPDFWVDEKVVQLTHLARLLFIGLWNFADDEGRMQFSPLKIKMQIFPADDVAIQDLFGELTRQGFIQIYPVGNVEYLQIVNFARHQKIDKRTASKFPAPLVSAESRRLFAIPADGMEREEEGNGRKKEPSRSDEREPCDQRHSPLREHIKRSQCESGVPEQWDSRSAKALNEWLKANPHVSLEQAALLVTNRFASDEPLGNPPWDWLPRLSRYWEGPLDKFKNTYRPDFRAGYEGMRAAK